MRPPRPLALAIVTLTWIGTAPRSQASGGAEVVFHAEEGQVRIEIGGRPLATYTYRDEAVRRPYFAHLKAPDGTQVTRNFPPIDGQDPTDHPRMHPGLWLAFGDLGGADDWRQEAPVVHERFVAEPVGGEGRGTFAVRNVYLDAEGKVLCRETCRYTVLVRPAGELLIASSTFEPERDEVAFGDQEEMGFGVRVATPLAVKQGGRMIDSLGRSGEAQIRGQTPAWVDSSAVVDGRRVGVAVLVDPNNFRPSWFHARDYGLLVANPFGRNALTEGEPSRVVVRRGEPLRLGFGMLLHAAPEGEKVDIEAAYRDYLAQIDGEQANGARTPGGLPDLKVSDNRRFLVTEDGRPFFYLADTAWELFHRLDRSQAEAYLDLRASQEFNVIQAVALAELDGLTDPNAQGDLPLIDRDPTRPAITPGADPDDPDQYDYWDHVAFVIDAANRRGLYIGLLPTWARWATTERSRGDDAITTANANAYGAFLGRRFGRKGVIWVLGGDRPPTNHEDVWRAMAKGIAAGVSSLADAPEPLMTFHPSGGQTSSTWFHDDEWLDFNMQQTGHGPVEKVQPWKRIAADYGRSPIKPVLDGEPLYEDHPIGFRDAPRYGYSSDAHVRQRAYWDVFSGACGHTYGHHSVWQMFAPGRKPVNGPLLTWDEAIHRPGADQLKYLRRLIESRPFLSRVPDPPMLVDPLEDGEHIAATRGDGYAFVYSGQGRPIRVKLGAISGDRVRASWFNPRDGAVTPIGTFDNRGEREFACPSLGGLGSDWVLVLDDAARDFPPPGRPSGS